MKQFVFLLAACALVVAGCQPQPIIIRERDNDFRRPVIIERPYPTCSYWNHCGLYSCPVCRTNGWYRCTPHDHCGGCPACRSNGWTRVGVGVQIGNGRIGVGVGVNP